MMLTLAGLLAAIVHDYEHEGVSNDFLVKSQSHKAITYNDKSVNENHHVAAAFRVLLRPASNFLEALAPQDFKQLRSLVVELVLGTDMAEAGKILQVFAAVPREPGGAFAPTSATEALLGLKLALKMADMGHLALSWTLHLRWVRRLEQEFFLQGDREQSLGMPELSFLMDRSKPGVTQSQVGFFDFVVLPMVRSFLAAFPGAGLMVQNMEASGQRWRDVKTEVDALS